jgi:hypothetical protein
MSERQPVENGHAEVAEPVVEGVLERLRPRRRGVLVPLAPRELADDHAADPVELSGLLEIEQRPVDLNRRAAGVLEEEDRVVEVDLPRRAEGVDEVEEAAADDPPTGLAARDRDDGEPVAVLGTGPVVSPPSTLRKRSAVSSAGEGLPNMVRLGP